MHWHMLYSRSVFSKCSSTMCLISPSRILCVCFQQRIPPRDALFECGLFACVGSTCRSCKGQHGQSEQDLQLWKEQCALRDERVSERVPRDPREVSWARNEVVLGVLGWPLIGLRYLRDYIRDSENLRGIVNWGKFFPHLLFVEDRRSRWKILTEWKHVELLLGSARGWCSILFLFNPVGSNCSEGQGTPCDVEQGLGAVVIRQDVTKSMRRLDAVFLFERVLCASVLRSRGCLTDWQGATKGVYQITVAGICNRPLRLLPRRTAEK